MDIHQQTNTKRFTESAGTRLQFPVIRKARFAKFYDYDNNKFFDFFLNSGSVVLGYNPKLFTTALKDSLSLGFYQFSQNHIAHQAKKTILKTFPEFKKVYFYSSLETLTLKLKQAELEIHWQGTQKESNLSGIKLLDSTLRAPLPEEHDFYLLSPAIANGFSIYALISRDTLPIEEDFFPAIIYQAVISTLQEFQKGFFEKTYTHLLKPYGKNIENLGGGRFLIPGFPITPELCSKLYQKGIFIHSSQKYFYLCQKTEEHQLKYLLNQVLK